MNQVQQPTSTNSGALPSSPRHAPASNYVTTAFYDWLQAASMDLAAPVIRRAAPQAAVRDQVLALLSVEARLLDQRAFRSWIDLYTEECAYWIPATQPVSDPRTSITLELHDRRRLLDRIARLDTGLAYSQLPASSTARQWGGLEIWDSALRTGDWHARCNFVTAESRNGHNRILAGWNGFVFREIAGELRIVVKQINLIDCDRPQGNNSFFL